MASEPYLLTCLFVTASLFFSLLACTSHAHTRLAVSPVSPIPVRDSFLSQRGNRKPPSLTYPPTCRCISFRRPTHLFSIHHTARPPALSRARVHVCSWRVNAIFVNARHALRGSA
ncbi:hypothetical protein BD779DRAFT_1549280 [Infundibulicybe gibba]|nr:hypothetical protein BD779DRAFT_1549280 [Infundibulicybe gibba]